MSGCGTAAVDRIRFLLHQQISNAMGQALCHREQEQPSVIYAAAHTPRARTNGIATCGVR